jgi:calcineurin-like phosphoesterase family protein
MVCGDTHGDIAHLRLLVRESRQLHADAIFVVGDFGFWEHQQDGVEFLDTLDVMLMLAGTKLYFLDGNHDKTSLILAQYGHQVDDDGFHPVRERIFYSARGHRWTWRGWRFISLGGAYSVDKDQRLGLEAHRAEKIRQANRYRSPDRRRSPDTAGLYWFPEEEMTDEALAKILVDPTPVDIMLTHDMPRGANPGTHFKTLAECAPNQDRIQLAATTLQPRLLVHGHLHMRYTDRVRIGDNDRTMRVEGLSCNPSGARTTRYRADDSYLVLKLPHVESGHVPAIIANGETNPILRAMGKV